MKLTTRVVLIISAAVLPLALGVAKAAPNVVMLDAIPNYYTGHGGGEFTAYTKPGSFVGNYAPEAQVKGGFETFCMETGVEFSPGATYYYTLGNSTQPSTVNTVTGTGLPLSAGVAYLYYQFGKGLLGDYDYTDLSKNGGRQTDADLLQSAIWYLQGGQSYGSYPSGINKFLADAITGTGGTLADAQAAYLGSAVQVLQLWTDADHTIAAQNQLVLTPVPDGGLTVTLLGGALIGLQVLRRKLTA